MTAIVKHMARKKPGYRWRGDSGAAAQQPAARTVPGSSRSGMVAGHRPGPGRSAAVAGLAAVPGGDQGNPGRTAARDGQAAALAVLFPRRHLAAAVGGVAGRGSPGQLVVQLPLRWLQENGLGHPMTTTTFVGAADAHLRGRDPARAGVDADQDPQVPGPGHGETSRPRRVRPAARAGRSRAGVVPGRRPARGHQVHDAAGLQGRPRRRHHRRGLRGAGRHPAAGPRPRRPEESRLLPAAACPRHLPRRRPGHHPRVRPWPRDS